MSINSSSLFLQDSDSTCNIAIIGIVYWQNEKENVMNVEYKGHRKCLFFPPSHCAHLWPVVFPLFYQCIPILWTPSYTTGNFCITVSEFPCSLLTCPLWLLSVYPVEMEGYHIGGVDQESWVYPWVFHFSLWRVVWSNVSCFMGVGICEYC